MKPKPRDLTEFSITHCLLYFISNRNTMTFFSSALLSNSPTFQHQYICAQACTSVFVLIDKIFLCLRKSLPESLETHLVFRSQTLPLSLHSHVCQRSLQKPLRGSIGSVCLFTLSGFSSTKHHNFPRSY